MKRLLSGGETVKVQLGDHETIFYFFFKKGELFKSDEKDLH